MSDIQDVAPSVLLPCSICSRTFRPEVLERHEKVCEKSNTKKRRVFDSFKSRVTGTELEEFLGPSALPGQAPKRPEKSPPKRSAQARPKWKETHDSLIAVLRAARGAEEPPNVNTNKHAGSEQCPSCNRFFGPRAFDRHVEFCKEKTARIKPTPSKMSQAQERLDARTKYRAPLMVKPKLTTKEKYSPMLPRKVQSSETSPSASKNSLTIPNRNSKPSPGKSNPSPNQFSRSSPTRVSQRQRSVSPTKKSTVNNNIKSTSRSESQTKKPNPPAHSNQPKIKNNLKGNEDLRPKTNTKLTTQDKIRHYNPIASPFPDESPHNKRKVNKNSTLKLKVSSDDESPSSKELRPIRNPIQEIKERLIDTGNGNLKNKDSRPIIQTDLRPICRKKKIKEKSSGEETPPPAFSIRNFSTRENQSYSKDVIAKEEPKMLKKYCKGQEPIINDLSVNDESYGIHVAACSVAPVKYNPPPPPPTKPAPVKKQRKPEIRKAEVLNEPILTCPDKHLPVCFASLAAKTRCSKIPKPVEESPKSAAPYPVDDDGVRRSREKTATIKKKSLKKWRDISEMTTDELRQITCGFELKTEFDDFALRSEIDVQRVDSEELSQSAIWEIAGEQFLKSDGSIADISSNSMDSLCDSKLKQNLEDDFIVLHEADPDKLTENETQMKLSVSEPCFSPSYIENTAVEMANPPKLDIVVFTASPKVQHPPPRKKRSKTSEMKPSPRIYQVREKTFLAHGNPKIKRRKLCEPESPEKNPREKIKDWQIAANLHLKRYDDAEKEIDQELCELKKIEHTSAVNNCKSNVESSPTKFQKYEFFEVILPEKSKKKTKKGGNGTPQKYKVFEISTDELKSLKSRSPCPINKKQAQEIRTEKISAELSEKTSNKCEHRASDPSQLDEVKVAKIELIYSDEESEEVRRKKQNLLVESGVIETELKSAQETYRQMDQKENDFQLDLNQDNSLERIRESDEESYRRNIEVEDFIITKPDSKNFSAKDEKCLESLFPKPREISSSVTNSNSTTAVKQSFVVDTVFDLRLPQFGAVNPPRILKKRFQKDEFLPEISSVRSCRDKSENSMKSLVDIWKAKQENFGNCVEVKATIPKSRRLTPLQHKNPMQM